jgi:Rps23 Pro-64 3,4-dihydroxylase Tpa1-like proline 4-hydroxylase
MKKELLENGFVSFEITSQYELDLLSTIYSNLPNTQFNKLVVSYDNVSNNYPVNNSTFKNLSKTKDELIQTDNLAQIWFSAYDTSTETNLLLKSIFYKFYEYTDVHFLNVITLYNNGCFIIPHIDGEDPNRIMGVLIYLNKDYNEAKGGNLILKNETKIVPEYGRVVIIDYTQNSVEHEVTKVLEGERYAICAFIHKKQ